MKEMQEILGRLAERKGLTAPQAERAMEYLMSGKASDEEIKKFLLGLKEKGESIGEIAAFARVLRKSAIAVNPGLRTQDLVDTCGSGGDKIKTFNVSTTAAFIAAGAGVPIAKHGNRSVSSKSGSADVLERLGVNITLDEAGVEKCIEEAGIGFMFAQKFHGAMRHVAGVRKELGVRTVFNILGPLISPASVTRQVYGIYDESLTEKLAGVLKELGITHAMVVHGMGGLDEISTIGETKVSELKDNRITTYYIKPEDFGLKTADPGLLSGGGPEENAKITLSILKGDAGPKRDIAVINAAAAIYVGGKAASLKDGVALAEKSIDSGAALKKLEKLIDVSNGR